MGGGKGEREGEALGGSRSIIPGKKGSGCFLTLDQGLFNRQLGLPLQILSSACLLPKSHPSFPVYRSSMSHPSPSPSTTSHALPPTDPSQSLLSPSYLPPLPLHHPIPISHSHLHVHLRLSASFLAQLHLSSPTRLIPSHLHPHSEHSALQIRFVLPRVHDLGVTDAPVGMCLL